jgi:hypothetical protein
MEEYVYRPPGQKLRHGHVYLIAPVKPHKGWAKGTGTHQFKIGVSKSYEGVSKRLGELNIGNWVELCVAYTSPEVQHPYNVELYLHKNYSKRLIRGEWFELSYAEYQYIVDRLDKEPTETGEPMRMWGAHIRQWGKYHGLW